MGSVTISHLRLEVWYLFVWEQSYANLTIIPTARLVVMMSDWAKCFLIIIGLMLFQEGVPFKLA